MKTESNAQDRVNATKGNNPKPVAKATNLDIDTMSVNAVKALKPQRNGEVICEHCHKPGHTKDQCWQINPCELCGELGHPAWRCKSAKEDGGVHNSTSSPSSEVKLKENFKKKYPTKG
jgi:hypothetical protein